MCAEDLGTGLSPETRFGFPYGLASGIRFGLGCTVRLWAFCLNVRESIVSAGMHDNFAIVQLSGKSGEERKHCKVNVKELEARGCSRGFVSFVSPGVLIAEGETHIDMMSLMFIYSRTCQLVR